MSESMKHPTWYSSPELSPLPAKETVILNGQELVDWCATPSNVEDDMRTSPSEAHALIDKLELHEDASPEFAPDPAKRAASADVYAPTRPNIPWSPMLWPPLRNGVNGGSTTVEVLSAPGCEVEVAPMQWSSSLKPVMASVSIVGIYFQCNLYRKYMTFDLISCL